MEKIIVFVSNAFEHSQCSFCDELYKNFGNCFFFIETSEISLERKSIESELKRNYIIKANNDINRARKLCEDADVVIFGYAPLDFIKSRIHFNKFTFYYTERLFKGNLLRFLNPITFKNVLRRFIIPSKNTNFYALCASSFASNDFKKIGAFKNKCFKWGYQPTIFEKNLDNLMLSKPKNGNRIIWVGRLVKLKHCDHAIKVVYNLKKQGINSYLDIIGFGEEEKKLKNLVKNLKLQENVTFLGKCDIQTTRELMDKSNIFLFTSDSREGWGMTLNECMNSGIACVASHLAGATNFLIKNNQNALIYKSGNIKELTEKTKYLIENKEFRETLGINAYNTIYNTWNTKFSIKKFIFLINELKEKGDCNLFGDGPCSKAYSLNKNWYKK